MGIIYKIHPAIGIARVGNHPSSFFIGPEAVGSPGVEVDLNWNETQLERYKNGGAIKRQAARFRVFRFNQDDTGNLQLVGEVTSADAKIEWKVDLCNRKAALDHQPAPGHPSGPRNPGVTDRNSLIIRNPTAISISGERQGPKEFNGKFLEKDVYLGELRTDAQGRLVVLGGKGKSESPTGADLSTFANNHGWHDDVADGPVTATVTMRGQDPVVVHHPSWVTVGPPDFAPGINSIVTLYDVAFQAACDKGALKPEATPSFHRHIKPLIERAARLAWVTNYARWKDLLNPDWTALANTGNASKLARTSIANRLKDPNLRDFVMPAFMKTYIDQWVAGTFVSDLGAPNVPRPIPEELDRAALDCCVGNNFYPGIEASLNLRDRDIYARPFRLDHTNLGKVYPGCLTEIMAVPWQADFMACDDGQWWPSQRPDIAMIDAANIPGSQVGWADPLGDYSAMVDHFQQLGFILPVDQNGQTVYVETDRDSQLPRDAVA
jgi:hypothetical protein